DYTPPWPRRKYGDLLREYAGVSIEDREGVLAKARQTGLLARLQRAHAAQTEPRAQASESSGRPERDAQASALPPLPVGEGRGEGSAPEAAGNPHIDHAILVNALFEEHVEHHLINPTFVIDFPAPLCPLTKRHPADPNLALRFEPYING